MGAKSNNAVDSNYKSEIDATVAKHTAQVGRGARARDPLANTRSRFDLRCAAQVDKAFEKVKSGDYKALKRKLDQSATDLGQLDMHIDTVLKAAKKEVKNLQRAENESRGVAQKDKLVAHLTNAADEAIREIEDRESAIESSNLGEDDLDSQEQ